MRNGKDCYNTFSLTIPVFNLSYADDECMPSFSLSPEQLEVVTSSANSHIFLQGPAGTGKTTAGVERMLYLIEQGVPGDSVLVMLPQRTLAHPYYDALKFPGTVAGGPVTIWTPGGLAQRMVELFWPAVSGLAGFAKPDKPPVFLTLESAQYFMARVTRPMLERGFFDSLVIDHNRLYSQIIDNLNKAAVVGFPLIEIASRLTSAWSGEPGQARIYRDAQECAVLFRSYCLENNLLDFSLQVEVFKNYLWNHPLCRQYLETTYRCLIFDNLEEDTPFAHDLLCEWLTTLDTALLIYDLEAGYRRFLGADPDTNSRLRQSCNQFVSFEHSFTASPEVQSLSFALPYAFKMDRQERTIEKPQKEDYQGAIALPDIQEGSFRFHNQMLDWAAKEIIKLVHDQGVPPGEIVLLAPYLSDALRFSLVDRLMSNGIRARSHRPSRALREEPPAQCLLTLAALAHPDWGIKPSKFDIAYAFIQAIEGMDLVRAQLLVEIVYRERAGQLSPFADIKTPVNERITFTLGQRYDRLLRWLDEYKTGQPEEIDFFFSRLFGEVLSQPGYRFHRNYAAGETASNLVDSAGDFRWSVSGCPSPDENPVGKEYLEMVQEGVIGATYMRSWQPEVDDAVFLSPAYTFLLRNRPVDVQFWIDIPSTGWGERLEQPLTHPYILSRNWPPGAVWTHDHEFEMSQEALYRLVLGLMHRCRRKIYLGFSELNEQGYEHKGPLMRIFDRLLNSN